MDKPVNGKLIQAVLMSDANGNPFSIGSAGFELGKAFRTFAQLNIANGATLTFEVVAPYDVTLTSLELSIDSGNLKLETFAAATPSGLFSVALPIFKMNNRASAPPYTSSLTIKSGGTIAGGILLDVVSVKVDTNTGRASSVGISSQDSRGIAAGTYYFKLTNQGADPVVGTFKLRWDES